MIFTPTSTNEQQQFFNTEMQNHVFFMTLLSFVDLKKRHLVVQVRSKINFDFEIKLLRIFSGKNYKSIMKL